MTDKIAEIRTRHSKRSETDLHGCYRLDGFTYQMTMKQSQLDLAIALAEVERLRARVAVLERACRLIEADPDPHAVVECTACYRHSRLAFHALEAKP